ncbi:DMT family transporter [Pseudoalteromonas sp. BDTF-M6]|uniref:DMT family transporter n=1 Tax=Pseudoalteromonas sp. BDTF-M6 TaxID=2796132 RepID=UPI001BAE5736|nr:DMT family transporter [Pseudoalteromonas sp. BDTF-M6]MBS3797066.1 DMT family transporter [Pseudoalteromonas sp. BDTF-M6]
MNNALLYFITVLIWGSTWLAIEFQLGDVAVQISLFLRFAIAAAIMWTYVLLKKLPMRFSARDHGFFTLLALCNFGANYLILYWAQHYLTSAMSSIAFSTLLLMNILNTRLFFGKPIAKRIYFGALLGIVGIVILFWPAIATLDLSNELLIGLLLCLAGTLVASIGNMVSVRNSHAQVGVLQGNAWGMLYSALGLAFFVLLSDVSWDFSTAGMGYWVSLLYLSTFGTVIAFACYFVLLKNIGPEKASYVIVLFPLVAVILSTLFEGFVWQLNTVYGFVFVLLGNAIVLTPFDKIGHFFKRTQAPA